MTILHVHCSRLPENDNLFTVFFVTLIQIYGSVVTASLLESGVDWRRALDSSRVLKLYAAPQPFCFYVLHSL